jgi:uncharacterized protein YndB with AHSA1/START domain
MADSDTRTTVEIIRLFNAPRELVFSMFTNEQHMANWWGPRGFTNPNTKLEVRVGGDVWLDMQWPDGTVITNRGKFVEIDEPVKLVFTLSAIEDSNGIPQLETHNSFTFEEIGEKTKLHMVAVVTKSNEAVAEALEGMHEGWSQSLDKLEEAVYLIKKENK